MLYQLSYTPRPWREVASAGEPRKGSKRFSDVPRTSSAAASLPLPLHFTIGRPIHEPSLPVNTRWVAAR